MHPITLTLIYLNLALTLGIIYCYGMSQHTTRRRVSRRMKRYANRLMVVLACSCVVMALIDHLDRFWFWR